MKKFTHLFVFWIIGSSLCFGQSSTDREDNLIFYINATVQNQEEDYALKSIQVWTDYLLSGHYVRNDSPYWLYDEMPSPDYPYISLLLDLQALFRTEDKMQCNIIGITPVDQDTYLLKSMFSKVDSSTQRVHLQYLISVYLKQVDDQLLLVSSPQYQKEVWENRSIGHINYVIHPAHRFDESQAHKMNDYNQVIAEKFEVPPIKFDYIVTNDTDQLGVFLGYDFFTYSHQPVRTGGMADNRNTILYSGNNSEYYPHELLHLYTFAKFAGQYHPWVDEGIAAFFGGSSGYTLDWHLQRLKKFLAENPDYKIDDLSALQIPIPNGEYLTDFRYAIGGLICKNIHQKEGMAGLFDALQAGRAEADYFKLIKDKLGIDRADFGDYIKQEMKTLKEISPKELEQAKYRS